MACRRLGMPGTPLTRKWGGGGGGGQLRQRKMLTLPEKLQTAPALLPMLVEGQKFIDLQDELSATWRKGMQMAEFYWEFCGAG